jgi:hypothetical protein
MRFHPNTRTLGLQLMTLRLDFMTLHLAADAEAIEFLHKLGYSQVALITNPNRRGCCTGFDAQSVSAELSHASYEVNMDGQSERYRSQSLWIAASPSN